MDYLEPLKTAFREKRFTIREYSYDASRAGSLDGQVERAKLEVQQAVTTLVRWCKAHFGEVYSGWMHLKVIRGFAESVLRYGLPVDFISVFVEPNMKKEKQLKTALLKAVCKLRPEFGSVYVGDEEEDGDEDSSDNLPFVCQRFNVVGAAKN